MKKIVVAFILIIILISGCKQQSLSDKSKDEDLDKLKEEINNLVIQNNELEKEINELTETVKTNDNYIQGLTINQEKMTKELNFLKDINKEILKINNSISRLDGYIRELPQCEVVLGHITKYDSINDFLFLDECEWIGSQDITRINELGLDIERDFPSGFHIYDEIEQEDMYMITEETNFYIIELSDQVESKWVSKEEFIKKLEEYPRLCEILLIDDKVIEVSERYTP